MAKKENEENKDINKESEEDFGLPDLEFEELDDIDEEEFDEADLENVEEEIAELIGETPDEDELSLDDIGADSDDSAESASLESESETTSESETLEDIGISDEETSTEESDSLPPIEDELQKETIDEELDEVEKFISEITADDVEEDSGAPVGMFATDRSPSSDDDGPVETTESSYEASSDEGGTSQGFTRVIIFGLLGAVIIAFGFLYFHNEGAGTEPVVAEAETASEPVEEAPVAEEPVEETQPVEETSEPEPVVEAPPSTASTVNPGTITAITASAGRYYVVVGSFIDDDMANDFGKELAAQGASVKIISPFNERKFFRVSVADYGTRNEAVSATEQLKSQYGDDIWALKY